MEQKNNIQNQERTACASNKSLPISTKHCVEICDSLRYKTTTYAKNFLEEVITLDRAVPFKKFKRDMGHKAGMAAGRFPQKAAKEVLKLIKSVEANAQYKNLDNANLKITKILANKASIPMTGGRHRRGTKRTHLEVEVKELVSANKVAKKVTKKTTPKVENKVAENKEKKEKKAVPKVEVKDEETKTEENKGEEQ